MNLNSPACSVSQSCPNFSAPRTAAPQASLSSTNSQGLPELMSIELVILSNYLTLYHPPLLLPSIFPSIRVFSSESVLFIRWTKYWSFSFSISPSSEDSVFISFRIDWFELLAVQFISVQSLSHVRLYNPIDCSSPGLLVQHQLPELAQTHAH